MYEQLPKDDMTSWCHVKVSKVVAPSKYRNTLWLTSFKKSMMCGESPHT